MKRTPIRARSAAKEAELRVRREMRPAVLARDGGCRGRILWPEIPCAFGLQLDEFQSRTRGGDPMNIDHVQLLCGRHNQAKEDHPDEAHARGLARNSWESPIVPDPPDGRPGGWPTARDFWNEDQAKSADPAG